LFEFFVLSKMLRVIGHRLAQRVKTFEKGLLAVHSYQKLRHDTFSNSFKTQISICRHVSNCSMIPALQLKFCRSSPIENTALNKLSCVSNRNYSSSSKYFAKNRATIKKEEVPDKNEKHDFLVKINNFFEDDPELKTTIVEMYEDFDQLGTPTGKIEKKRQESRCGNQNEGRRGNSIFFARTISCVSR